jgi:hypothetical protein
MLLPCQLRILTPCLKWWKGEKPYCCWFLFQCQNYPVSLQVRDDVHFCVCTALILSHEIFPLFCVLFVLHSNVNAGYIFFFLFFFGGSFTWHILQKSTNEHPLFNRMCSSHSLPWLHDWAPITSSAHEMRIILCDSPVNTDVIFCYTLRAQILEDCVSVQ